MQYKYYLILLYTLVMSSGCSVLRDDTEDLSLLQLDAIPVEITTDYGAQRIFYVGDEIQFLLSLGSDAYIYMYHIDANADLLQLLPNVGKANSHYKKGYFLTIPEYEEGYRFVVNKTTGKEEIWIFASDTLINPNIVSRNISDIRSQIKQQSRNEYGEYVFEYLSQIKTQ